MGCEEYGIRAFGFDNARIQTSKQQEGQDNHKNQKLQTGQSSKGFLHVRGDQWTTAHVAVSPTLGCLNAQQSVPNLGLRSLAGYGHLGATKLRSASSTESQTIWERLAATVV